MGARQPPPVGRRRRPRSSSAYQRARGPWAPLPGAQGAGREHRPLRVVAGRRPRRRQDRRVGRDGTPAPAGPHRRPHRRSSASSSSSSASSSASVADGRPRPLRGAGPYASSGMGRRQAVAAAPRRLAAPRPPRARSPARSSPEGGQERGDERVAAADRRAPDRHRRRPARSGPARPVRPSNDEDARGAEGHDQRAVRGRARSARCRRRSGRPRRPASRRSRGRRAASWREPLDGVVPEAEEVGADLDGRASTPAASQALELGDRALDEDHVQATAARRGGRSPRRSSGSRPRRPRRSGPCAAGRSGWISMSMVADGPAPTIASPASRDPVALEEPARERAGIVVADPGQRAGTGRRARRQCQAMLRTPPPGQDQVPSEVEVEAQRPRAAASSPAAGGSRPTAAAPGSLTGPRAGRRGASPSARNRS